MTSIKFLKTGVVLPVVEFETREVLDGRMRLSVGSGADVCIIEESKLKTLDGINSSELLIIDGVAGGEFKLMEVITKRMNGMQSQFHVVPDTISLDCEG